jgi:hypothetical protein
LSADDNRATSLAEIERDLARQKRELAAEQNRLADADDARIGSIRRRAAALYIVAALRHEVIADGIDSAAAGAGDVEA